MQILPDVEIIGLSLYIRKLDSLVIGDVHIGYEEALNKRGVLIPRFHFRDVVTAANNIFQQLKPLLKKSKNQKLNQIIINGDLKHEFGIISGQEWREALKFLDLLAANCEKVVVVKGNHDIILGPIAKKRNIELAEDYCSNGFFICHGHKIPEKKGFKEAKTIIIGNEHPAISIKDGARTETFKCFLKGAFRSKKMVVMPSFNPITMGTDVLKEHFISPFLKKGVNNFEVFVVADRVYPFGKIKNLK